MQLTVPDRVQTAFDGLTGSGAVWVGATGVLALAGGRSGRRAAARGVLTAGLTAVVAGPASRMAIRRAVPPAGGMARLWPAGGMARLWPLRPDPGDPRSLRLVAVAYAFAAGAAQEAAVAGAPLLALAGLVTWSQVKEGRARPPHAAAAAALGVGLSVATRRLWPVAPHDPAEVRKAMGSVPAPRAPAGHGVVVVVNPKAGWRTSVTDQLHDELPESEVVELGEDDDLVEVLKSAAGRATVLGVAGGDGSVNAAALVAADHDLPLMVVPGGTLNHFAHAVGLTSVADAGGAVREGSAVAVDRSMIDGRPFLNAASLGSYTDLVDAREKLEGRIGKWPAVVVALWRVLGSAAPLDLELDGERRSVWMVFLGNCRYHPAGFAPSWRERLDDGELDIRIVDGSRPLARGRLLASVLTGRLAKCRVYEQRYGRELGVRSAGGDGLRVACDGETFDASVDFTVAKADDPLVVYVPPS